MWFDNRIHPGIDNLIKGWFGFIENEYSDNSVDFDLLINGWSKQRYQKGLFVQLALIRKIILVQMGKNVSNTS